MITVYGFGKVTPEVIGITRDLRVLWALEECGLAYQVHGLTTSPANCEAQTI
jgi:glutathione S-transferase